MGNRERNKDQASRDVDGVEDKSLAPDSDERGELAPAAPSPQDDAEVKDAQPDESLPVDALAPDAGADEAAEDVKVRMLHHHTVHGEPRKPGDEVTVRADEAQLLVRNYIAERAE